MGYINWIAIALVILIGAYALWRFNRSIEQIRKATYPIGNVRVSYSEPESKHYPYTKD